ncbi:hypothetical protein BD626DRAFT_572350 [Schizophyllum amplum]|uniref:TATA-binding protein-associated factor mot1 n=1 Tax=Schizophyllum amplum TaxID=97359 RepID=A0A550C593_9AGAR|nr:hypothetical protein BD626DRAFT_572350 [Auriculariopsis ampla]
MSSRLDRLLLLLDTGSSASVRQTAAKQLAQLAAKAVTADVTTLQDDIKASRQHAERGDPAAWAELMAVLARILPYLHSRSHDTRVAASVALSQICTLVPLWVPNTYPTTENEDGVKQEEGVKQENGVKVEQDALPAPDVPSFSVQNLIAQGKLLLSSSGKEFLKPHGILSDSTEVKKARKEAMGRLGLDFLDDVADEMDLDKELASADAPEADPSALTVKVEEPPASSAATTPSDPIPDIKARSATPAESPTVAAPPPVNGSAEPEVDLSALSARERNRLKRKRKPGNSAVVHAPPPQASGSKYNAAPAGPSNKARLVAAEEGTPTPSSRLSSPSGRAPTPDKVVVDPSKGGAIAPKTAQQSTALEVRPGTWAWEGVVSVLTVDLFNPAWQVRHGATLALRELLRVQGKCGGMRDDLAWPENQLAHERWCNHLAAQFLCVFVLDRFSDFVSDQVTAPVRETISQTMGSLLLHMPRRSVTWVHSILLQMIKQDFVLPANWNGDGATPAESSRSARHPKARMLNLRHVWEVRHSGLLGLKYEVAVRDDLFVKMDGEVEEGALSGKQILQDVVDSAILGLGDHDDDVRAVAASCLLPIAEHLVKQLPESLDRVMVALWACLSDMKDDLSSSVGAVMDLLGKLVAYDVVIDVLAKDTVSMPMTALAPTLFPFFRHTIANVRLSVVQTLTSFMDVPTLPKDWISAPFMQLLYQNLLVEERADIREASLHAWRTALSIINGTQGWLQALVQQDQLLGWFDTAMTPIGVPIPTACFYQPSMHTDGSIERHNVDKNMISQDQSLINPEIVWKARIACATALAGLIIAWPEDSVFTTFEPLLVHYMKSPAMIQQYLGATIATEWAQAHTDAAGEGTTNLADTSRLARSLVDVALAWVQSPLPSAYHEMMMSLGRIFSDCSQLLASFHTTCKLPQSAIPYLGSDIDVTGAREGCFTLETAQAAVGRLFQQLRDSLGRAKKKEVAVLAEKRVTIAASIERYIQTKGQYDIRVAASFAGAIVFLGGVPDKVTPVVKGIMEGVKSEENADLQARSCTAIVRFIEYLVKHKPVTADKIIKNLCTFLCKDTALTPTFAYWKQREGILSAHGLRPADAQKNGKAAKVDDVGEGDPASNQISARGATMAFRGLSTRFGPDLLEVVPNMWVSIAGGLLGEFNAGTPQEADKYLARDPLAGQNVIDTLSVLEAVIPALHEKLWPRLTQLFPMILLALQSKYGIIRQIAARSFATVCAVLTQDAMRFVIEHVVPLLGDALSLTNRQGSMELLYHIVQKLDIKALPYVIFMVVPVLGRMSDLDEDIRATATNTFASLVKMVPLEAGLPDPPGFSEDLLKRREEERQFLMQLLDGSKVDPYVIPVPVKAELRKYQQDGVNWLAFLAKYQLHGILCDDMGLGKTLQSICILASKHFERAERHRQTQAPDAVHLPSLIVCPPTLTGHWYYEILKYVENLRPVLYTGNARERQKILGKIKSYDVVITSYEVVRNDITSIGNTQWLYCILDEGHVIKNAKTKLTKAVKSLNSQHRLILSGTPIQNNVLELWSLFDFLMPGFLGTESSFNERFGKPILSNRDGKSKNGEAAALALEALHKQVLPFLLRRLKEDVLHDLPPKIIQDYYCELSELQKNMYDDFSKSRALASAEGAVAAAQSAQKVEQQHIFQSLQYLRKLCNHPALVLKNDQEAIAANLNRLGLKTNDGLKDIQHAPKLLALRQLLTDCGIGVTTTAADSGKSELIDAGPESTGAFSQHRVLIFCQMKQMLDIIETDLFKQHMPSVTYMRLDGGTDASKRHAIVQTFNADPSIDCLLLTTHVGGLGLTLTGADTVIFVEHDWNPMKDLQAMDRAHRIGQKKVVNVYRLVTKGTLEEKIMGLQRFKLNIANSVVTQQNSGLASMDTDLVLDLFKRTTEEEDAAAAAKRKSREAEESATQNKVLQGLEDLPAEEEYQGLDLASFMSTIGR